MTEEHTFNFTVYGRHYNHPDTYTVIFNKDGWHVSFISINGQCDRRGNPVLYANFRQDSIIYPSAIPSCMEDIWERYNEGVMSKEEVQEAFDKLGAWIDSTGNARPMLWD